MASAQPKTRSRAAASGLSEQPDLAHHWARRHLRESWLATAAAEHLGGEDIEDAYAVQYVRPLLRLLDGYVRTGDRAWLAAYQDERTRFLPAGVARDERARLLTPVLEGDLSDLSQLRPAGSEDLRRLEELHHPLLDASPGQSLRWLMVGDCLMTEIRSDLVATARAAGIDVVADHVYFSASMGVGLDMGAVTAIAGSYDVISVSFLTYEALPIFQALLRDAPKLGAAELGARTAGVTRLIHDALDSIREQTDALILLHNACGLPLTPVRRRLRGPVPALSRRRRQVLAQINRELAELAEATQNCVLVDERAAVVDTGIRRASRPRFPRSVTDGALFHHAELGALLAIGYGDVAEAVAHLRKTKVIAVDFDNTLWSGVMAEGDVVHDHVLQSLLRDLKEAGVLLVATSKNDEQSIRWEEMTLERDDFVLHKISWDQKAESIQSSAHELDLGLDTFVLLDDNPVERELVRRQTPEVAVLDPTDPRVLSWLRLLLELPATTQTAEAGRRTQMYREAAARRDAISAEVSFEDLMSGLELRARWTTVLPAGDPTRVAELLARTNQFNTTTRRRKAHEIELLAVDPECDVLQFGLSDRFGDYGIVGVVIVERRPNRPAVLDSVVMSCRAMGFGFETLMVATALGNVPVGTPIEAPFVPTQRNGPAASLFASTGFVEMSRNPELISYELSATAPRPQPPAWFTIERG